MSSILDRLAQLSPERRRLLQKLLEQEAEKTGGTDRIRRRGGDGPVPLSFAQQRLWFIDQLDPGTPAYNMPFPLRLRGRLEAGVLRRALGEVVRRHEALRTVFAVEAGEPVQVVRPPAPVPFPLVDLSGLPAGAREAETLRLAGEEAMRPFDLARGPLLRATLLRLDGEDHAALFTMHHVVSDGWSMGVLTRELSALYHAFARAEPSPLPEPPVQYADYALWQRERLSGEGLEAQLAWWRERLEGAPPTLDLPTDRPAGAAAGAGARAVYFALSPETTRGVAELARREGATPFMVLLAAWQLLLGRYAGEDDVVVGTPVANRTQVELEGLIGFFVNTLALRTDLSGDPAFRELLGRVRATALGAYQHQDLPFERLVEELAPERSLTHTPLFQVMFALQNVEMGELELGGLRMEPLTGAEEASHFALGFSLQEHGGRIAGTLHYRTDLFEESTVARLLEHYRALLEGALADPARPASELSLLAPGERERLLGAWGAARALPDGPTVPALLAAQAARTPGAVAAEGAGGALTYAELERRSDHLAAALRARGVGPEVPVGICLERGPGLLVAVLAAWKAGGAYLPLDPDYPAERLRFMLADSAAPVAISAPEMADRLAGFGGEVLAVEGTALPLAPQALTPRPPLPILGEGEHTETGRLPGDAPPPERGRVAALRPPGGGSLGADALAYVIYTSGSTGAPKGVRVQHGTLARTLRAAQDAFGFGPGDVVPSLASFAFDIWLFEAVLPLLAGARVRLLPRERVLDTPALARELEDATAVHAVPALMRQVAGELAAAGRALPGLRRAFVGGDAVPPELLEEMRAVFPAASLHVLYGPTEGTVICAAHEAGGGGAPRRWIGRPLGNAGLYVVDGRLRPVPAGVAGELCVGAGSAARDYLGRPGLTAERWVPDPFSAEPGARMYRTGDRVRWTGDGELEFLGRTDAQVKVRGFRIEPGEVEATLSRHPGVREAAVAVRSDGADDPRLVAYVVPAEDAGGDAAEGDGLRAEHVGEWETLFGDAYAEEAPGADPDFDVAGWESSYTGEPIPAAEMREWVERTAERVAALAPRRVLEIGCGTGLVLFRVAPGTEEYWGTDFSRPALDRVRREAARPGRELSQLRLLERAADDFAGIPEGRFDLVVVNSVAQYFPGVDYLLRVLEGAVRALAPGGAVFVGDVRSLPLLEAFHASVELHRAPGTLPAAALRERVRERAARDKELVLDPELFRALPRRLPRVGRVEVRLKRGVHPNEMTRFRYDVLLRADAEPAGDPPAWRRWEAGTTLDDVRRELEAERPEALALAGVPNARVAAAAGAVEALLRAEEGDDAEAVRRAAEEAAAGSVDPEALWRLGEALGYAVHVRWSPRGRPGAFDVLLAREGSAAALRGLAEEPAEPQPLRTYASDPLREKRVQRLLPELRAALAERLPEYMVPSAWVLLDRLPLTPSGKLDRARLPAPDEGDAEGYAPPRTRTEAALAETFAEVLRRGRVGIHGDFFALGGHSLLATRVVSRVREAFGIELPLRALFEAPTPAGLAARVDTEMAMRAGGRGAPPVRPVPRDGRTALPLSFAQLRLWFLERLEPGTAAYNIPLALRLRGALDPAALRRALAELVRRHESLRTVFAAADGEPVQVVSPPGPRPLPAVDLAGLPAAAREREARRLAGDEGTRPFDLERGPLLRTSLLRLAADEWALLLAVHHAVSDGWSMQVAVREVSLLYAALARGEPSPLPEPELQFADYAAWERARLSGEGLRGLVGWWAERLRGAPALLELPTDRPRPARRGYRGAEVRRALPRELRDRLEGVARREGATLYMVVLAAFDLLLGRLAGQDNVVVGTPIAGRTRRETEGMIGLFVNTLPVRADLAGAATFRELLGRVREAMLGAYEHQEIPFEKLVDELRIERSLSHTPVFQVMFNFLNLEEERRELPGLSLEPLAPAASPDSKFDFTLYAQEDGGALALRLLYTVELFDAARMEETLAQLHALLAQAAEDPDRPLAALSLATPAAAAALPDPAAPLAPAWEAPVHARFAARAARDPARVAVRDPREEWSYGELAARAHQLAHRLRADGLRPGDVVAVHAHRCASLPWALLGVLAAGGAFLVLDPAYPGARLARQLRAARPRALLRLAEGAPLAPEVAAWLAESGAPALELPPRSEAARSGFLAAFPADAPPVETGPGDLAYLAFTSGTTGAPKGILGTHAPLAHFVGWQAAEFGLTEDDRFAMLSGLAHDPLLRDVFTPLSLGAALCVPDADELTEPGYLARWLAEERVTAAHLTPAAGSLLAAGAPTPLPALRHVFWGGDKVRGADVAALRALAPGAASVVFYGATETPQAVGFHRVAGEPAGAEVLPVGQGIEGAQLLVLAGDRHAGIGEVGEICVRTPYLARGYLDDEAGTRERFVPNPLAAAERPDDRVYRTGDLGRYRPDGTVQVLGRADAQVKVRGFRVEPGEVEAALREHPAVRDAAVVLRDLPGGPGLAAYYVPAPAGGAPSAPPPRGEGPGEGVLRGWLRARLPEYMVPAAFVALDALPLTPNGKLDRRALPAPGAPSAAEHVPPRPGTEQALAEIWEAVLGVERVGATDGFFALGGHSLLATRMVSRVREALGVELPLRALFEAPTLAELAARVDALRQAGAGPALPPIRRVPRDGVEGLPLSFAQQRLWFIHRMDPLSAAYHLSYPLRLRGALDVPALERSLADLTARHETLRTVLPQAGGGPVQVVLPPAARPIPTADLRRLPEPAREDAVRRLVRDEAARPFDLAAGPLLRVRLARVADDDWVLCLTMHHVIADGWSMGVLTREVNELYRAHTEGGPARLPELPVQYADYAAWQREWLEGGALEAQLAWWRERLADAPPLLELPTDFPRRPAASAPAGTLPLRLPAETGAALRALCRGEGATPFMGLLTAFALLLGRYAGEEDVVVGSPIAGRTRAELEGLIGFFVNTLPLRADLSGEPGFRALLGRVRETTLGAYQHQDLPFERLVEELAPERSLSHSPLFQVVFALQNVERGELRLGGLRAEPVTAADEEARFDLSLTLFEEGAGFAGALSWRTDLFAAATVERMAEHLRRLLDGVLRDPDAPASAVGLLAPAERDRLLAAGDVRRDYPRETVHALFAGQARRTPDAVALSAAGETVTYAELDRRSDLLAARLREAGVGPESRVGIFLERSPALIAAMLAALKAGGAYVPLDPGYPAERLAWMLEDSGARVLLTAEGLRERLPAFGGEVVEVEGTPLPPAPSPARGEGENGDYALTPRPPLPILGEGEHTGAGLLPGDAPPPERGRVAALRPPGGGPLGPENLAYVIYTSGSTGTPKGAAVPHRAVARLVRGADYARFGPEEVFLQLAPVPFDASTLEIWGALLNGGRLEVFPPGTPSLAELGRGIEASRVTTLWLTAGLFHAVVDERPGALARVRQLLAGGDVLSPDHVRRALEALPGTRLVNGYGPTENTTFTTCHEVAPEDLGGRSVPIGRPIANTRVVVLDAGLQPVPAGVPGELYAGGEGLARGYLDRPELTAERFVPDPVGGEPGARLYRTGDRVRWRPDGALEFLGRLDAQVKVRGFRVEPGEVEAALRAHPAVREAAAVVREDARGERRLVAYAAAEGGPEGAELRRWLAGRLPEYMLPSAVVVLDALPLTPNGKLDRRALPAPEAAPGAEYVAPRDATEEILAGIWAELLGAPRVGVHDDFFALGGHSLLATRLAARVRETFGVELPLRAYFEAPTVAGIAERLAAERPDAGVEAWEMDEELERIAGLSDEEVRRLLGG